MAITSQILVSDKKSVLFGKLRFSSTHSKYKKPHWGPLAGPRPSTPCGEVFRVAGTLRAPDRSLCDFAARRWRPLIDSFLSPNGMVKWYTKRRNSKSWWGMVFLWFGDKDLRTASGSRWTRRMQTFSACVVSCCKKTTCKPQVRSPSTSNLLRSVKYVSKFKT